ncbi:MAG: GGDEF domain-containing protein [Oscillospiraceae bacterium]
MRKGYAQILAVLCTAVLCCAFLPMFAVNAAQNDEQSRIIKVGLPLQDGIAQQDASGKLSGYTYDFLQEIAQFTSWEYEFKVMENASDEDLIQMLKAGEIDVLGSMLFDENLSMDFHYTNYNYLSRYDGLYVLDSDTKVTETNYMNISPLRVAVNDKDSQAIARLDEFAQDNDITIEKVICGGLAQQKKILSENKADAIWTVNMGCPNGLHPIAKAFNKPVYFMFAQDKANLAREMDAAMIKISKASPQLTAKLQKKYFERSAPAFFMTSEETAFVNNCKEIKVLMPNFDTPTMSYDKHTDTYKGIAVELLSYIHQLTGINFKFILANDIEQMKSFADDFQFDMLAQMQYDYELAKSSGVVLSRPYVSSPMMIVANKESNIKTLAYDILALPEGFKADNIYNSNIVYYKTVKDCLDAVNSNKAQYTLGGNYVMQYWKGQNKYNSLSMIQQGTGNVEICFGISKHTDENLLNIINKVITNMPQEKLNEIIYSNIFVAREPASIKTILLDNPIKSIIVIIVSASIIVAYLVIMLMLKNRNAHKLAIANERFLQLCELTEEYLFEYDIVKDKLILSENIVRDFGGERIMEHYHEKQKQNDEQVYITDMGRKAQSACEICVKTKDGSSSWYRYSCKLVYNKQNEPIYGIGKFCDINAEKRERERLIKMAGADSLTGLRNTENMRSSVKAWLRNNKDKQGVMFMMDIDGFKIVNDTYGHFTGDLVLVELADLIRATFTFSSILGRIGGDEFMIFREVENLAQANELCEELRICCKKAKISDRELPFSLSIGAVFTNGKDDFDELYKRADAAMYAVKRQGGDSAKIVGAE